uniref:Uncharacterized protein n=1 Tax=Tanacetum cinerariifolium TaxID=118510 RepID=A0A6L2JHI2_TANCI|nr:hypothetical protein [Tanacetum cinerariifolium]
MEDTIAQTRFERVSKHSNNSLLAKGNTLQSDEDSLKLDKLMALCTTLQNKVLDLEKITTTQRNEIASLKRRVKKLKKKNRITTKKITLAQALEALKTLKPKVKGIVFQEPDEVVSNDADKEIVDVDVLGGEETFVAGQNENVVKKVVDAAQVSTAVTIVTITTKEITLVQALEALKTLKPKGKRIMIEEPIKPKKKDQIRLDEKAAKNLQVKLDEEERLAREKAEKEERATIALIEE